MWKSKKFILIAVVVAVVLVGSISGVVLAQTGSTDNTSGKTLLGRVATILGIDQQTVESAFAKAQRDMRDEALSNYLQKLVDQGKITKEQADQYQNWWQARPETPMPVPFERFGAHRFPGHMGWGFGDNRTAPCLPTP